MKWFRYSSGKNLVQPWPTLFSYWRLANALEFRIWRFWILIPCWYNRHVLEAYRRDYGLKSRREVRAFWRKIRQTRQAGVQ